MRLGDVSRIIQESDIFSSIYKSESSERESYYLPRKLAEENGSTMQCAPGSIDPQFVILQSSDSS